MARNESDREDLLREATALVERVEVSIDGEALRTPAVVAGFRKDGALSLFFGADPVYQFNAGGELRRAFVAGLLYKAARGRLVSLERVRTRDEVQLLRRDLTADEERAFVEEMCCKLNRFAMYLQRGNYILVGQVPPTGNVVASVLEWLVEHDAPQIAASPRV